MLAKLYTKLGVMMMMIMAAAPLLAQPPDGPNGPGPRGGGERIQALRIAFISKELNLSPEEAKVFWPVYDKRDAELKALRKDRREEVEDLRENFDMLSDAEVDKAVQEMFDIQAKELEINRRYYDELKKVIPQRKAAKLFKVERDFRNIILREMHDRRPGGPPPGGRGPMHDGLN